MAHDDFRAFRRAIGDFLPKDRLIEDPLRCFAYGTDASFYRLTPKLVLELETLEELRRVLAQANRFRVACTFRAAGTSLSGQAVTDSVLLTLGRGWQASELIDGGKAIRLQPGVVGAQANRALAPAGRRIGPDPASIDTAKIGGIAANNASGMCCGTTHNSYQTLRSMKLVMADGTLLDTADELSCDMFRHSHGPLLEKLREIATQMHSNKDLGDLVRRKYRLKNTTGYGINALLDFDDPIEILQHLMIGSEGTLGFIAEITLETIPEEPGKATGLMLFETLEHACMAVSELANESVSAVELIDRKGLAAVSHMQGVPFESAELTPTATALLIEVSGESVEQLGLRRDSVLKLAQDWRLLTEPELTNDRDVAANLWAVRKGLFPAVGAVREAGTTVIIEDVAFPVAKLVEGVRDLRSLLESHGYHDAVMFGHALEGNLHFVFSQSFEDQSDVDTYECMMEDLARLVAVKHGGSLKAEHGTGRNMAPFVELEWGSAAYELMRQIKSTLDPHGVLNPGVIINPDPRAHLKALKPIPATEPLIDQCIECGFCEPVCPSRDLTLTPRQRIAAWREIHRLSEVGDPSAHALGEQMRRDYSFAGTDSCAACGLCEMRCPVNINTGDLTRVQRSRENQKWGWVAGFVARNIGVLVSIVRVTLSLVDRLANLIGRERFANFMRGLHRLSRGAIPLWLSSITPGRKSEARFKPVSDRVGTVVYVPACPGRIMDADLSTVMVGLLERAGYQVIILPGADSQCCGMPFASKGFADVAADKGKELLASLQDRMGMDVPTVICDASPCSQQLQGLPRASLYIQDAVAFLHDEVLPRLDTAPVERTVAVHATCSDQRSGNEDKLLAIARSCANRVFTPEHVTCCGFAGDKGFTLPALNASALEGLPEALPPDCREGYSSSRTCEIGLSDHAAIPYKHIAYLLFEATTGSIR